MRERVGDAEQRIERRIADRRLSGNAMDVSRLEHENLFRQVNEVLRRITRIELELHQYAARLDALESASRDVRRAK